MSSPLQTYDDWLSLTDEARDHVKFDKWSAYARDGLAFAFMAAARLAMQSAYKILDIRIGTYHCGEYVLHMTVSSEDFEKCPPMLTASFEGFRVVWMPERSYAVDPSVGGHIEGTWIPEESKVDYEFEFQFNAAGVDVSGVCRATNERLLISDAAVNREYVLFTAHHPTLKKTTRHVFRLVAANRCEDLVERTEYYIRAE
jgi:hypothetical protein